MTGDRKKRASLNDIPVNVKLLASFIICVIIPLVLMNAYSYYQIDKGIRDERINMLQDMMDRTERGISSLFSDAVYIGNAFSIDRAFLGHIQDKNMSQAEYYDRFYAYLKPRMEPYKLLYTQFSTIKIYADNPAIINGGGFYNLKSQLQRDADDGIYDWYGEYAAANSKVYSCCYNQKTVLLTSPSDTLHACIIYMLDGGSPLKTETIMKIDLNPAALYNAVKVELDDFEMLLVDQYGRIICSSNQNGVRGAGLASLGDTLGELPENSIDRTISPGAGLPEWRLIGIAMDSSMQKAASNAQTRFFALALISFSIALVFYAIIYRSYNKRISELLSHMSLLQKHEFVLIDEKSVGKDEIGQLISRYNGMTSEINRLVNSVHALEMEKKDMEIENIRAEMLNMQSQMDPHFIYNTLSAMAVVSMKENYPKLVEIIYYLSRLLRRMVDRTDSSVSVQEELIFTEMYLKIERFRFQNRFNYSIDMSDEVKLILIPKFIIQPLVENSCKHGIHARSRDGCVNVAVRREDECLYIRVADDGAGFEPEKLASTIAAIESPEPVSNSVGLRNVYRRLHFEFGGDMRFVMKSVPNERTTVEIWISMNRLERTENETVIPLSPGGGLL